MGNRLHGAPSRARSKQVPGQTRRAVWAVMTSGAIGHRSVRDPCPNANPALHIQCRFEVHFLERSEAGGPLGREKIGSTIYSLYIYIILYLIFILYI